MGLWSVTAMVLPADPLSFVDVVGEDTEGVMGLSCDQTLSRMPKDQNK